MKNVTLSMDEELLEAGRDYAARQGTTLNQLVRDLLDRTTRQDRSAQVAEMFRLMDAHRGDSRGKRWKRDDLYAR